MNEEGKIRLQDIPVARELVLPSSNRLEVALKLLEVVEKILDVDKGKQPAKGARK